ncbi:MAG: zinc ribbon domain-containing protein, partial [Myxococcota bacterium]
KEDDSRWTREAEALIENRLPGLIEPRTTSNPGTPQAIPVVDSDEAPQGLFDDRPAVWKMVDGRAVCSGCGHSNDADGRFCTACGRPRAAEAA